MEPNNTLLYSYSTVTHLWAKPLIATASSPLRYREWTIVLNSTVDPRVLVFGGATVIGSKWSSDLWTLDSSGAWVNLTAAGAGQGTRLWPLPTVDHTAHMLANGQMVVVGGRTVDGKMGDLSNMWVFDTKAGKWERQKTGGSLPVNRAHHTSVMSTFYIIFSLLYIPNFIFDCARIRRPILEHFASLLFFFFSCFYYSSLFVCMKRGFFMQCVENTYCRYQMLWGRLMKAARLPPSSASDN